MSLKDVESIEVLSEVWERHMDNYGHLTYEQLDILCFLLFAFFNILNSRYISLTDDLLFFSQRLVSLMKANALLRYLKRTLPSRNLPNE